MIRRLPDGRPIVSGRSECEGCGRNLAWWELAPLLSFAALRGRCATCRRPIGWFHPGVEVAAVAVAGWALWATPGDGWVHCGLGWTLLTLAWIDWEHMRLPDVLTLPLLAAGLALTPDRADHALAAAAAYGLFRGVAWAFHRWRGIEGLGQGDAKLFGAAGAWVGVAGLPPVMLLGALLGLGLAATQGRAALAGVRLPFGPALALATWLVALYPWLAEP